MTYVVEDREIFNRGLELFNKKMYREAATQLNYFLSLPSSTSASDRSDALLVISQCTMDINEARQWAYLAIKEAPDRRECFVRMAKLCCLAEEYDQSLKYAELAFAITEKPAEYVSKDWAWDWQIYDIAAVSAWVHGDTNKAREYGAKALEMNPNHERLKKNVEYYLG